MPIFCLPGLLPAVAASTKPLSATAAVRLVTDPARGYYGPGRRAYKTQGHGGGRGVHHLADACGACAAAMGRRTASAPRLLALRPPQRRAVCRTCHEFLGFGSKSVSSPRSSPLSPPTVSAVPAFMVAGAERGLVRCALTFAAPAPGDKGTLVALPDSAHRLPYLRQPLPPPPVRLDAWCRRCPPHGPAAVCQAPQWTTTKPCWQTRTRWHCLPGGNQARQRRCSRAQLRGFGPHGATWWRAASTSSCMGLRRAARLFAATPLWCPPCGRMGRRYRGLLPGTALPCNTLAAKKSGATPSCRRRGRTASSCCHARLVADGAARRPSS